MCEEIKYYSVTAKCGHVGNRKYVLIDFPVKAINGREAAKKCRNFPRVKHTKRDAIVNCKEISIDEYEELMNKNEADLYLQCHTKQAQKAIENFDDRVISEETRVREYDKVERNSRIKYKLSKYKLKEEY